MIAGHCVDIDGNCWHEPGKCSGWSNCDGKCCSEEDNEDNEAWIIWFDDPDVRPVIFIGAGSTAAARQFYEDRQAAWNCHLFRRVNGPDLR